ncbi:MAG: ubiquinone/menaquinone biosynthesis C-methyltransferase UbiE [Nitrospirales bacterium]|nr:MAG: ubiquinone/menaquinone biosynthesis C-methyltransferase UbiE [Nitrospirales bacterium]
MVPTLEQPPKPDTAQSVSTWTGQAREQAVQRMFTAIAGFYDLNNSLLSFGLHHHWKKRAMQCISTANGGRALDLGAGTGDLAILLDQQLGQTGQVVAADLNEAMLRVGLDKVKNKGLSDRISCFQMNAEHLTFQDKSFDTVTAGFCIRNVGNRSQAFTEIRRVLKPGGQFVCLEFSQPTTSILRKLYDWYSFRLLPWIGTVVARDGTGVYEYLPASIRTFPDQERLRELLLKAGFQRVDYQNLSGGIVAIHIAVK